VSVFRRRTIDDRGPSVWRSALLCALWTLAFVGVAALLRVTAGVPDPAYALFEWISRVLPGAIITVGIETIVGLVRMLGASSTSAAAKAIEQVLAVLVAVGVGAISGAALALLARRLRLTRTLSLGAFLGMLAAVVYVVFLASPAANLVNIVLPTLGLAVWGLTMGALVSTTVPRAVVADPATPDRERRRVMIALGTAAGAISAIAFGLVRVVTRRSDTTTRAAGRAASTAGTSGAAASPSQSVLGSRWAAVPGTRAELTDNADFYRVDINLTPPSIAADSRRLKLGGLVGHPRELTLDEIRARPSISQIITLECISNPVGGDLIGTSRWTGVSIAELLRDLDIKPDARALAFLAADGFHESHTLADVRDPRALLVYEMNGEPLTAAHGFPLRLYLPDRHGMKLPKWIHTIEVVSTPRDGYWVERGWSKTAVPHTTAVIDTAQVVVEGDQHRLAVGGIAYAGARGISRVEVQVDRGAWQPARLRAPALSPLTWVQWRFDTTATRGLHSLRVRAFDGTGAAQETTVQSPHPDGATGLHGKTVRV
jgi:DMSO/TMAO reductase YedYZ molybdopterin-dependent catalytic subunit